MKKLMTIKKLLSSDKGFNLVELIVAMAVVAIVISMAAPSLYTNATSDARTKDQRYNREIIVGNLDKYFTADYDPADSNVQKTTGSHDVVFKSGTVNVSGTEIQDNSAGFDLKIFVADDPEDTP